MGATERAVVFPGQGSLGGETSGAVREAVLDHLGKGDVPYQLAVFAGSVDLLYRLRDACIDADVVAGHSLGEYAAAHAAGSLGLGDGVRLVAERDRLMNEASKQAPGGMVALIGADPDAGVVAGHSLGEYAAAHAAGSLDLGDGVRLVAERDRLMNEASKQAPGGMVALIGADPDAAVEAAERSEGAVVAANFNSPRQIVLSGQLDALEEATEGLRGRKVRLQVAGAFHSPLMAKAAVEMEVLLEGVELDEPDIPMIGATDGAVLTTADGVREALRNQMLSPVRWVTVVERLLELGVREIFEAGEDGTLTRMLRDFKRKDVTGATVGEVLA